MCAAKRDNGGIGNIYSHGFGKCFTALIVVCAMFCVPMALARREPVFGPTLTHWDECAAYVALCLFAVLVFRHPAARLRKNDFRFEII